MRTIAHIVNPFSAPEDSDLSIAQPLTFLSMIKARDHAREKMDISLYAVTFPEDAHLVPEEFKSTKPLERSVADIATFHNPIRLPLIADILGRLFAESDAEYLIYTNVDIGLYPSFYTSVNNFIEQGHDAFMINRRRIPAKYKKEEELEMIFTEPGKPHPGFDCFVFHRSIFPKMQLANICIGVPFFEITFSQNLFALAGNYKIFSQERLTFHIGMEIFKKRAPRNYFQYNRAQFWRLIWKIDPAPDLRKFPYARQPWVIRIIRWGLHPCIPIRLVLILEKRRLLNFLRQKPRADPQS